MKTNTLPALGLLAIATPGLATVVHGAGEADLQIPGLDQVRFDGLGGISGITLMYLGILVCFIGAAFGLAQYQRTKKLPVHDCMSRVSRTIWETCKTYLFQQGKFLAMLWGLIAGCILFYFKGLEHKSTADVSVILAASVLGILGSYGVAWFGIRINTTANSRTAFSALQGNPLDTLSIPLQSGTFLASYFLLGKQAGLDANLWWVLSAIISCGTAAGALIPEFSKIFTSTNCQHVKEITNCSKHGGASLNILSGFVAGNFSAFWTGLGILALMFVSCLFATYQGSPVVAMMPLQFQFAAPIFAFGLVAFGFLGMGPVTIAVDSYGPVTDNAQSVYELSRIESRKNIRTEIEENFGFEPDFENAKYLLEKGDGVGNTFKATAKPVLIGTAVVGATTMVFGIIILLDNIGKAADPSFSIVSKLSLVMPEIILGLLMGGSVIYWFTGASCQAVVTGAYRAVVYIKEHIKLDAITASEKDSKEVVRICTVYAQKGMWNIFIVIFCLALALAFFNPYFFIGYLIAIAFFGLFQAIFMANAGGAWDNAKKIVEVELRQKGTDLHAATVVGDTVGDPFKDTCSVALNPVVKFTTLFGLLAVEIAVTMPSQLWKSIIGGVLFVVALIFVHRSFYAMRIPALSADELSRPDADEVRPYAKAKTTAGRHPNGAIVGKDKGFYSVP